jgi:hypothetical protein
MGQIGHHPVEYLCPIFGIRERVVSGQVCYSGKGKFWQLPDLEGDLHRKGLVRSGLESPPIQAIFSKKPFKSSPLLSSLLGRPADISFVGIQKLDQISPLKLLDDLDLSLTEGAFLKHFARIWQGKLKVIRLEDRS